MAIESVGKTKIMPFHRFICPFCLFEKKVLSRAIPSSQYCEECEGKPEMVRTFGLCDSRALETRDEYRGKKTPQNLEQMIEDRAVGEETKRKKGT